MGVMGQFLRSHIFSVFETAGFFSAVWIRHRSIAGSFSLLKLTGVDSAVRVDECPLAVPFAGPELADVFASIRKC